LKTIIKYVIIGEKKTINCNKEYSQELALGLDFKNSCHKTGALG